MDIVLLIIGFVLCLIGIIGSFLPVLPGPFTSWIGLLLLCITKVVPQDWTFLGITLGIAVFVWILDYIVPVWGTKRFGGTKYGMIGSSLGLLIGVLFFPPFGIILGPFAGAFVGELVKNSSESSRALKAAFGSFLGFLAGTLIKFTVSVIFLVFYINKTITYWKDFF